jgi:CubicO group peptidase (beta-lactamase class C family)
MQNKWSCSSLLLLGFILFHSACAQVNNNPAALNYLNEEKLIEHSTVLLNNQQQTVPVQDLASAKIASVHFSFPFSAPFDSLLNKYAKVSLVDGSRYAGLKTPDQLTEELKLFNTLIVQLTDADLSNPQILSFITTNQKFKKIIVVFFGSGPSLAKLDEIAAPVLWLQHITPISAAYAAQTVFGGIAVTQQLDRTYAQKYVANSGFLTKKTRLQYGIPEDAGVNSANLVAIDNIARDAIAQHATPGCVVLVVKDGKVIYNKAFGYHTYDAVLPDQITDIFDLASVTKVSATTMEAMKLVDQGKLSLDGTIGSYIPLAARSNKSTITARELLEHQAGLIPDIPTFEKIKPSDYRADSSAAFPVKVVDHYFLRKDYYADVMMPDILNSPVRTRGKYVYSDLSMIMMMEIEEHITSSPLNVLVQQDFYTPLGMQTAGFLPLRRFPATKIIPTEDDEKYRHTLLDGYTHDPTAALMGNVAGHAGLFATANDVAILYSMVLNKGQYGGVQYIQPATVDLFTAKQSDISRRGLGFDRWDPARDRKYPSELASPQTYGHTGYTGTCVWVDPAVNLIYVFLSNRVNPAVSDKLGNLNVRPRIHDAIYQAIQKGM